MTNKFMNAIIIPLFFFAKKHVYFRLIKLLFANIATEFLMCFNFSKVAVATVEDTVRYVEEGAVARSDYFWTI